jgi:hypothetical protein
MDHPMAEGQQQDTILPVDHVRPYIRTDREMFTSVRKPTAIGSKGKTEPGLR